MSFVVVSPVSGPQPTSQLTQALGELSVIVYHNTCVRRVWGLETCCLCPLQECMIEFCEAYTLTQPSFHQLPPPPFSSSIPPSPPPPPPIMCQVFSLCDPEGKGFITRETLATMCNRRNSVLDSIMSTLDHDKDGRISYDEFQEGFQVSERLMRKP